MTNLERRKLTEDQVRKIRRWWDVRQRTPSGVAFARELGITQSTLYLVAQARRYKEIA